MKRFVVFVSLVIFFLALNQAFAQKDPNDPGKPDSVWFYPAYLYYPLPSGPGIGFVHIKFVNDDSVTAISMPLTWAGDLQFDSVTFRDSRVSYLQYKTVNPKPFENKVLIGAVPVEEDLIPPGRGIFATLCFTIQDIGAASVDTIFFPPLNHLIFVTIQPVSYTPRFVPGHFSVIQYHPGDVDFDSNINLVDVIYLANYILKNGPLPPHPITADVNSDCAINLIDVIYLANNILKNGPDSLPGCIWNPFDP